MPLMQDCVPLLFESMNRHTSAGTSLWLAFLTSVQQGRALACDFVALDRMSTHCHTYQKHSLIPGLPHFCSLVCIQYNAQMWKSGKKRGSKVLAIL